MPPPGHRARTNRARVRRAIPGSRAAWTCRSRTAPRSRRTRLGGSPATLEPARAFRSRRCGRHARCRAARSAVYWNRSFGFPLVELDAVDRAPLGHVGEDHLLAVAQAVFDLDRGGGAPAQAHAHALRRTPASGELE